MLQDSNTDNSVVAMTVELQSIHRVHIHIAYYTPVTTTADIKSTLIMPHTHVSYYTPITITADMKMMYRASHTHIPYYSPVVKVADFKSLIELIVTLVYITTITRLFYPYPSDKRLKRVGEMVRVREIY